MIRSETWPAPRLVSQAIGRPSVLRTPKPGQATTLWYAAGTRVVARWIAETPIELRIGDATP
jgi:hypothetical protein